jgi:hypothetical protein
MLIVNGWIKVGRGLDISARSPARHVIISLPHAWIRLRGRDLVFVALGCRFALHRPSLWSCWLGCVRV